MMQQVIPSQEQAGPSAGPFQKNPARALSAAVFAGHSGGHLFPAVAFAEKFRERFPGSRVCLVTSSKGKDFLNNRKLPFDEIFFVAPFPWKRQISADFLLFPFKLTKAFWDSYGYLGHMKPDLSVGFGSYASFPGILASRWMHIPTLIHEQNFYAGEATRRLAKFADCVTSSFPACPDLEALAKVFFVGLPVRKFLVSEAAVKNHEPKDPASGSGTFRLLVVGGSQGSHRINETVVEVLSRLRDEEKKIIAVNHIAGSQDEKWVAGQYLQRGIQAEVWPFYEDMNRLYQKADMAITRAGANTLFELALFKLPAIVIPYPHAGRHQSANAQYFSERGAVLLKEEEALTPEWMLDQIRTLMHDPPKRQEISQNISKLAAPGAAETLVSLAEKLMAGQL